MNTHRLLPLAALIAAPLVLVAQERPPVGPPSWTSSSGFPHIRAFEARPGPDAEYLVLADTYTLEEDGRVVHERHSRLTVNSYLAINRKHGETKLEYDPTVDSVEILVNRTVLPSGQIVDAPPNAVVDDQPVSAHRNPLWSDLRRKVIVHTALEPGAVIETTVRITRMKDALPWLELGEPLTVDAPVHERVITVDAPQGTTLRWEVTANGPVEPAVTHASGRARWTWRLAGRPGWSEDAATPHRPDHWPFLWASTCPSRNALEAELGRRITEAGEAPAGLEALARTTAEQAPSKEVQVLKVLEAVKLRLSVSSIPEALLLARLRPLAEVWRSGWATHLELAALQQAALKASGLEALPTLVATPGRELERVPAFAGTERVLLAVSWPSEGGRLYDPVHPDQGPPLEVSLADRDLLASRPLSFREQQRREAARALRLRLEVGPEAGLGGTLVLDASGASTPHARLLLEPETLAGELAAVVQGASSKQMHVVGLERDHASLTATLEGQLPAPGPFGLVSLEIGGVPSGAESGLPPLPATDRLAPVAMPGPLAESLGVTLVLPEGWTVAALPVAARISNAVGSCEVTAVFEGRELSLSRRFGLRGEIVATRDLPALRELLQAWRSPEGRKVILRPAVKEALAKALAKP